MPMNYMTGSHGNSTLKKFLKILKFISIMAPLN